MEILESYKNLFLHPRDFAQDKLASDWAVWKYIVALCAVNILPFVVLAPFFKVFAELLGLNFFVLTIIQFFAILILNSPFRKETSWEEVWRVNLAYFAYIAPFSILIQIISYYQVNMVTVWITSLMGILSLLRLVAGLVLVIWLAVSQYKILSELHETSAWKIFGWSIIVTLIMAFVIGLLMSSLTSILNR